VRAPRCHLIVPIRDFFRRDPPEDGVHVAVEPDAPAAEAVAAPTPTDEPEATPPHPPSRFSPRAWIRPRDVPPDLWVRCGNERCRELIYTREFEKNLRVCHKCQHHARLAARERIAQVLDEGSFHEEDGGLHPGDPLDFVSAGQRYQDKLIETQRKSGMAEAIVCGTGRVEEVPLRVAVADFGFMGASMGSVVGEKIARAAEHSIEDRLPLLAICSSGGARMHEGIFSLMQMAKTSAALARLAEARVLFVCLLSDPTTGGVTASFAGLGDIMLAEPGALVGFAGPRVIEQITKQKLPPGTQGAEFQLEHGMVDNVVHRRDLRPTIARLLRLYSHQPAATWKGA
jgi:acetyl-CoA carboxylase carboxyl transferase subunit beta